MSLEELLQPNNSGNSSHGNLPACRRDLEPVDMAAYSVAVFNILSCGLNLLHMLILSQMASLRGSAYYHVLMHLSAADLYFAAGTALMMVLSATSSFNEAPVPVLIALDIFRNVPTLLRYWLMAAASFERYHALCRPLSYKDSKLIGRLKYWLSLVWLGIVLALSTRAALSSDRYCWSRRSGPMADTGQEKRAFAIVMTMVPSALAGGLMLRVAVALCRMRARTVSEQERQIARAVYHAVFVVASFYVCYLVPVASYAAVGHRDSVSPVVYYVNRFFFQSLYGVINVIVYGWFNQAYREQAQSFMRIHASHSLIER